MSRNLIRTQISTCSVITWCNICCALPFARCFQLFRTAIAVVCIFLIKKLLCPHCIDIKTLRLQVRTVLATNFRALIPMQSKPFQSINSCCNVFISNSSCISIFNTEKECSTGMACVCPIKEGGTNISNMKIACWRWCETNFYFLTHRLLTLFVSSPSPSIAIVA
ncbi:unannotated protein [freshwater metagenome]|uniref:Unannotated protein n=1 Tax=freshwater metagenome TaxID=449393 RepID=A0A6J6M2K5_9ZZZZ